MPDFTFSLTDAEHDAVSAGLPGDPETADARVREYLAAQVEAVVAQHVHNAKKADLRAAGLSEKLADANLDDEEVEALKAIRADKRAAAEEVEVAKG